MIWFRVEWAVVSAACFPQDRCLCSYQRLRAGADGDFTGTKALPSCLCIAAARMYFLITLLKPLKVKVRHNKTKLMAIGSVQLTFEGYTVVVRIMDLRNVRIRRTLETI